MIKTALCGLISLIFCLPALSQSYKARLEYLEHYIDDARQQWQVPGLAVAIVKDGKTLMNKGFGERKINSGEKVDERSIFGICSTTKAIVAAGMAMLVDEGKIDWDDKVMQHMPEFQLYDPYVSRELKVRDLFTHNAGLGNADVLWGNWAYGIDEILYRIRYLKPSYSFRGGYTYQNIMYAAVGKLIEKISGENWGGFVQRRIFDPLGMESSFTSLASSQSYPNRSIPHHIISGKVTPIFDFSADIIGSAGSIWSCTEDMQKWMNFMLDSARVDGQRFISAENYEELLKPQTIVTESGFYPTQSLTKPTWRTYALGWFQHDYRGRAVSFHTGSLQGTVAIIGLIPGESLGVYVFGNLDHAEVRHAIMYKVFDVLGERDPEIDWSTDFLALYTTRKENENRKYKENLSKQVPNTQTSYPLTHYTGTYVNEYLGEIFVSLNDHKLSATIGNDEVKLSHFHFDTFLTKWLKYPWRKEGLITFDVGDLGDISFKIFGHRFKKKR